jgi:hypothetical protein
MLEHANRKKQQKAPSCIRAPEACEGEEQNNGGVDLTQERVPALPRWLTVEQVRKLQRMRRESVIAAMLCGELPFEKRGRITYIRLSDVTAWEERRLKRPAEKTFIHSDLLGLL